MHHVTLIGDSIRMYYTPIVRRELEGYAEIDSSGQNGGTSRNVLLKLEDFVLSREPKPDLVHVNCGLHDLARERNGSGAPRVSVAEYEANVACILRTIQKRTGAAVVWATTTPVNEAWHTARKEFERLEADVDVYNAAALRAAYSVGVPVNNLFGLVMANDRDKLLTDDGVHYKDEGSELLGKAVAAVIRREMPKPF